MARVADEELKKAFQELHEKVNDTRVKLTLSDMQIENHKRRLQFAQLTNVELAALPENTRLFESVGRMFLLQSMDSIKADIEKRSTDTAAKIKTLENNKALLQRNLKECENNIREMIQRKQEAS